MIYAGFPSMLGLGFKEGHAPTSGFYCALVQTNREPEKGALLKEDTSLCHKALRGSIFQVSCWFSGA